MRILVVEDNEPQRERLGRALRDRGHMVETADSADTARAAAGRAGFDAAVVDVHLGAESGLGLLGDLACLHPGAPIVVVSANMSPDFARAAKCLGAAATLSKPFDPEDLLAALSGVRPKTAAAPATRSDKPQRGE